MPDLKNLPAVEPQIAALADQLRPVFEQAPETVLIGVFTGGVWIAERLAELLLTHPPVGSVAISGRLTRCVSLSLLRTAISAS